MINEHLMRPGSGSVQFVPDAPMVVLDQIRQWVDENASGPGAHIVITPIEVDVESIGDASALAAAIYTGRITRRPSTTTLEFVGLSSWLDSYPAADITNTSGAPSDWLTDLLVNDISQGTVTDSGATTVTKTFPAYSATYREMLDKVAALGSWEYALRPDFTIDAAIQATLFKTAGTDADIVITDADEGSDGAFRGVEGGLLDQSLDVSQIATHCAVLGEGLGGSISVGSDSQSVALKTHDGSTPVIRRVVSAPLDDSTDAGTTATNVLNLASLRRQVSVSTRTPRIRTLVEPGDEVYLHDIRSGLFDTSQQITFRGETITPAVVRCLSLSWPIEEGYGVYVRKNGATAEWLDVTRWVEWEWGDAFWKVGDWSPPNYGPTNRTAPEIEERVATSEPLTYTPSLTNVTIGNGSVSGWYQDTGDGWISFMVELVMGSTTSVTGAISITTPTTMESSYEPLTFTGAVRDASPVAYIPVIGRRDDTAKFSMEAVRSTGLVNATNPITFTTSDRIHIAGRYRKAA